MIEEAILFGEHKTLVGVITHPAEPESTLPAVILMNAGVIHRVGPNRLHVKIARRLAALGFTVLRFDFSGIGDSSTRRDNLPFKKSTVSEAGEAMDYLQATQGATAFLLMGICLGARVSIEAASEDTRIVGAVLINLPPPPSSSPEVRAYLSDRQMTRYFWQIVFNPGSWLKVVNAKSSFKRLKKVLHFQLRRLFKATPGSVKPGEVQDARLATLRALIERNVCLLFIYAEDEPGLEYTYMILGDELEQIRSTGNVGLEVIPRSDHTFALLQHQEYLVKLIEEWAQDTCLVKAGVA